MIAQGAVGVIEAEDPVFELGAQIARRLDRRWPAAAARRDTALRARQVVRGAAPTSAASISVARNSPVETSTWATPARVAAARHGRQVVVLVRAQQASASVAVPGVTTRVISRFTSFLAELGIFHLVADGHAVALLDQARDVAFGGVIRHAAHGDGCAFFLVAGGERDFQFARGDDGVFEEQLVEIAQAEHQQRVGDLLLDGVVLPHQRRGGVGGQRASDRSLTVAAR